MTTTRSLLVLALAASFTGCSGDAPDPRLAPIATATLEPGVGLGPLKLGVTSLEECVAAYGTGSVSIVMSDSFIVELSYASGGLELIFPVRGPGIDVDAFDPRAAMFGLEDFLAEHPEFGALKVTSLSVGGKRSLERSFFQGTLSGEDVRLFDAPYAAGLLNDGRLGVVAGMSPNIPRTRHVDVELGLAIFFDDAEGPGDAPTIVRFTIFLPEL